MTVEELTKLNQKFQAKAFEIADLLPQNNYLAFTTGITRSAQKMDTKLKKILNAKTEVSFYNAMEALEEEMDELIFTLDRLDHSNKTLRIQPLLEFVKRGYELLSLYSICCDQIIEKKMKKEDEFE